MDPLDRYCEIVRRLIEEYASYKPADGDIRTEAVVDRDHDHYEVVQVGWDAGRCVHKEAQDRFDRSQPAPPHPGPMTPDQEPQPQQQCQVAGEIPLGVITASTSLCSRNEPGNAGLHYGIEPDPRLDSFANLPHGLFR